ncbi:Gfo/Idh/MocA family oxidoreductase [Rubrivirga sp. S365]|uniref:Gfo/Idh/MocA family protein n=1 Tax=Rubrivirga sp. S365 TaxID=3076080 RepID=UPI0028C8E6D7|nr:Gfo/Idh/MocA family oxidoreductase [Rubrivirga sp. S365]MDT7855763.1 Gfo/Idh/MocA family oxidoreductase [Rubrivirga sp. S365]
MSRSRPLRIGMVGGGPGAFIGDVHRRAIRLDGLATLVAGVFSSDPQKSKAHAAELGVERAYGSYEEMAEAEAARDDGIDVVSIVTPNWLHAPVAHAFIARGISVICDKPMTTTLADAEALVRAVREAGVVFALTHNYTGYPLVKQARALVADGVIGEVRKVVAEYSQGWLATAVEREGSKQAAWRTDPEKAGAGALGDIGSHAENLAAYVTGLRLDRLCADVRTFVPGRAIDDDANVLLRYEGGAAQQGGAQTAGAGGVLHCSQIAAGVENDLRLRVSGTEGTLIWRQEEPNALRLLPREGQERVYRRGHDDLAPAARHATRLPPGHPEAFFEAFANVYAGALRTIAARRDGREPDPLDLDFPTVEDGARGVHFIQTALESGRREAWVDASYTPPT